MEAVGGWACGSASDTGRRRRNEDALLAGPLVFAVADGMGGHEAGDLAARIVVEHLGSLDPTVPLQRHALMDEVRRANRAIAATAATAGTEMGTTITGLAMMDGDPDRLLVFNVGDSRVYRMRSGFLTQLTRDHSVVQELIDRGVLTHQEVAHHPERSVITRSLGYPTDPEIDWWLERPAPGDRYLITSDGLTNELDPMAIGRLLDRTPSSQRCADDLVAAALEAGGRDNITVIVVDRVGSLHRTDASIDADTAPRSLVEATAPAASPSPEPKHP
jgi:protein phosphatase